MCLKWYSIIEKCCKKRHFEVNRMNSVNFKSTKPLLNAITNRKICSDGQKVRWLDIQWIRIQKDKPFVMQFKCSMNDDLAFSCVSLAKRGRPRSLAVVNLHCTRAVVLSVKTRSSAIAEGPRDASCQLKSCQLPRNSAETIIRQVLTKSMVWSWRFSRRQCVLDNVHSTMKRSSRLPLSQVS